MPSGLRVVGRWTVRTAVAVSLAYAVLLGVQHGYDYATTSPRFEVRGLEFSPTTHVDDQKLRALMQVAPGTNILALDLDAVAARIVSDPWVAKATVVRVLPDTLQVTVEEHVPTALVLAGDFHMVDQHGVAFKSLERGERGQLPVITGFDHLELLTHPQRAQAKTRRALEALTRYQQKRRPRLSEIHVDDMTGITLYTASLGSQLRLGRGDVGAALARYDALRAALGEESDSLAVAHLDASTGPGKSDRVVASFFASEQVPALVAAAEERMVAKAKAAELELEKSKPGAAAKRANRGRKRSRIPRYE